ncbi:hypothetical protein [Ornithobacterium rhinotracheale]|uniref:hypothetical protein n=1 Tax=Ornithobacterium rhinotracheale TaxID=28251 RepID=UPI004035F644
MNKKLLFLPIALLFFNLKGQVGIGTNDFSTSEAVKIESSNRGILLPRFTIPDPPNRIAPAKDPKQYMIAFNKNPEKKDENGLFYTYKKDNGFMAWRSIIDENTINSKLLPVKHSYSLSSEYADQPAGLGRPDPYNIGEETSAHKWVLIPGLEKTINITSKENNSTILVEGIVQADNGTYNHSSNSFAVGLFIDGRLKTTRTYIVDASYNRPCGYKVFNLKSNVYDLEPGNHKISVYAITRNKLHGNANTLSFGTPNKNCLNSKNRITSFMSEGSLYIQTQEF